MNRRYDGLIPKTFAMTPDAAEPSSAGLPPVAGRGVYAAMVAELEDGTGQLGLCERAWVTDRLGHALRTLNAGGEVRVRVIDDTEMATAHERYSGIAGTTDVLTFDLRDDAAGPLDVDILVCLDEAKRQAAARGHLPEHELLLYAVHGVLHCLGHDDHDSQAFERMHAEEDRVLAEIGLGPIFGKAPQSGTEGVQA